MEERLKRPDLSSYTKKQYIKKMWWFILLQLALFITFFVLLGAYPEVISPYMVIPLILPFGFMMFHYDKLYWKRSKEIDVAVTEWENQPEIRAAYHRSLRVAVKERGLRDLVSGLRDVKMEPTETIIIKDTSGDNYMIIPVTEETLKAAIDDSKINLDNFTANIYNISDEDASK